MWPLLQSVECTPAERGFLRVHAALLDDGYRLKRPAHVDEHGIHLTILPNDWKAVAPKYAFSYENLDLQALVVDNCLNVHLAKPDGDLLSVSLLESEETTWPAKIQTHLIDKMKPPVEPKPAAAAASAPSAPTPQPPYPFGQDPLRDHRVPFGDPRDHRPQRPQFFTPDGGLFDPTNPNPYGEWVGPNDPRWRPGRQPGPGGMMPRFDPVGPGGMDPDNDILRPPGFGGGLPDYIG